ncbi:hypothetical protein G9F31_00750 [Acinetobacter sp. 187]|uniref:holin n=1 Tax=Acinetobacter lanii TaxID=2715163 RepID=UPI0014090685|nr:hypothetical protein [Acinetobacter lanii]NHC02313.1 hypothetical protein [Acinetobacter lanii]
MSDTQVVDASAAIAASKVVGYTGSGIAGVSAWVGTIDLGFWISIGIALAGFAMNWYFAKKKDKRDEIKLQAFLKSVDKGECNVKD